MSDKNNSKDKQTFYQLYKKLVENCIESLTDRTVFARLMIETDLPEMVEEQVSKLIEAYMGIWDFVYKHPGAVGELEEILADDDPRRRKAKKQLRRTTKNQT